MAQAVVEKNMKTFPLSEVPNTIPMSEYIIRTLCLVQMNMCENLPSKNSLL